MINVSEYVAGVFDDLNAEFLMVEALNRRLFCVIVAYSRRSGYIHVELRLKTSKRTNNKLQWVGSICIALIGLWLAI